MRVGSRYLLLWSFRSICSDSEGSRLVRLCGDCASSGYAWLGHTWYRGFRKVGICGEEDARLCSG